MNQFVLLIVEDEAEIRDLLVDEFSQLGINCVSASCTQDAIDLVTAARPHAILSDMMMPDGDGLEMLSSIRALGCEAPMVFLTGQNDQETKACALLLGAMQFHAKPYDRDSLQASVIGALRAGKQLSQELRDLREAA